MSEAKIWSVKEILDCHDLALKLADAVLDCKATTAYTRNIQALARELKEKGA
jgi:hypothetical protein